MRTRRWSALFLAGMVLAGCTSGAKTHVNTSTHVEMPGASERDAGGGLPRDVFHVDMVSKDVGWALAPSLILLTIDGGHSWQKISSESVDPHGAYLPPSHAWFFSRDGNAISEFDFDIAGRVIGERREMHAKIRPDPAKPHAVLSLGFLDPTHGWLIEVPQDQLGKPDEQDVLYVTDDGGVTWTVKGRLPEGVQVTGATFVDAEHGWITGVTGTNHLRGIIYRTTDGGETWNGLFEQQQDDLSGQYVFKVEPYHPVFFDDLFGVIPISTVSTQIAGIGPGSEPCPCKADRSVYLYVTSTGGEHLTPASGAYDLSADAPAHIVILDLDHWWIADSDKIYRTTDGGVHWVKIFERPADRNPITDIQFLTPDSGFIFSSGTDLFKTVDGGVTWTLVAPVESH